MATLEEGLTLYNDDRLAEAYEILSRYAEAGDDEAQLIIGLMYYRGEYVDQDSAKAAFWLKRSARQHNVEAASLLMECDCTSTAHTNRF